MAAENGCGVLELLHFAHVRLDRRARGEQQVVRMEPADLDRVIHPAGAAAGVVRVDGFCSFQMIRLGGGGECDRL